MLCIIKEVRCYEAKIESLQPQEGHCHGQLIGTVPLFNSPSVNLSCLYNIPKGYFQLSITSVSESERTKSMLSLATLEACRHWLSHLHPKLAIEVWPHARAISESVMSIPVGLVFTRLYTVVSLTSYALWSGLDLKPLLVIQKILRVTWWPKPRSHLNHTHPPPSPSYMYGLRVSPLASTSSLSLNPQSVRVLCRSV